jgi:hypothetical protein
MLKFFSKSAFLIVLAVSIQPASAQMWRGANFRPSPFQHQGFRSMTSSSYRLSGQRYVSAPSMRDLRLSKVSPTLIQKGQRKSAFHQLNLSQAQADPHGTSGNLPQGSYSQQGVSVPPQGGSATGARQGASYAPQGAGYQPAGQSGPARAVSYCILSGGVTCPTLNPPGSHCECRDNFGRHFRGVAQ